MPKPCALPVKEVAKHYGVGVRMVYGWIKKRELNAVKLPGGDYRVMPDDLAEFDRRCRGQGLESPNTGSGNEAGSGFSAGPTPTVVPLGPFQRGRQTAAKRKSGETSS